MRRQQIHQSGFTLIELLTVIAIIAILAGLLFPAIRSAMKKAEATQAKTDIKAIETAIKAYYTEYGKLPVKDTLQGQPDSSCYFGTGAPQQYNIIFTLRGIASGDNAGDVLNPRKIVFFEPPGRKGAIDGSGNFVDPWAQVYYIKCDCNYDNVVDYFGPQSAQAIIVSYGPDGIQSNITFSGVDDIVNFK